MAPAERIIKTINKQKNKQQSEGRNVGSGGTQSRKQRKAPTAIKSSNEIQKTPMPLSERRVLVTDQNHVQKKKKKKKKKRTSRFTPQTWSSFFNQATPDRTIIDALKVKLAAEILVVPAIPLVRPPPVPLALAVEGVCHDARAKVKRAGRRSWRVCT